MAGGDDAFGEGLRFGKVPLTSPLQTLHSVAAP